MIKSKIILSEVVKNKDRKFGAAPEYYPAMIEYDSGGVAPVLFTNNDIDKARKRASDNPEDIPVCETKRPVSMWEFIFGRQT